jgi:hypothetical protein
MNIINNGIYLNIKKIIETQKETLNMILTLNFEIKNSPKIKNYDK